MGDERQADGGPPTGIGPGFTDTQPIPTSLRPLGARRAGQLLLKQTVRQAWDDRIFGLSAEAGFWQLLSLPPLLLAVLGTIGFFGGYLGDDTSRRVQDFVSDVSSHLLAPSVVNNIEHPIVSDILAKGRADVVSIGFLISLWSGSSAMATYVNTITIAYDLRHQRSAVRSRALAFGLYLLAVAYLVVVLPLLVVGPNFVIHHVPALKWLVAAAYWPVLVALGVLGVATLYHLAVPVRTRYRRGLPGAVVAIVLWVASSAGLRFYLGAFLSKTSVYGQLGAVVAVLLFLYFTAFSVLFGAELNGQADKLWPSPATAAARRREHQRALELVERRREQLEFRRSEGRDG